MAAAPIFRPATKADAAALAVLVDIAGEGIPAYMWSTLASPGQSLLELGRERARRDTGGFSYRRAIVAEIDNEIAGGRARVERHRRQLERSGGTPLCARRLRLSQRTGYPVSGMPARRRLGVDGKIAQGKRLRGAGRDD